MRKHPKLVAGAALFVALALGWLFGERVKAQVTGLLPPSFNGLEVWPVALQGPGGTSEFVTTGMLRNTTGVIGTAQTTGTANWPAASGKNGGVFSTIIFTTALTGAVTFDLPPTPFDGQLVTLVNGTGSAFTQTITATPTDGSSVVSGAGCATLAATSSCEFVYLLASNLWYRVR